MYRKFVMETCLMRLWYIFFLSMTAENMEHSLIRQVTRRLLNVAVAAKKPLKADCNLNTVSR